MGRVRLKISETEDKRAFSQPAAFSALQSEAVGLNGSTSAVVSRSLTRMRDLLDRSFAEVRLHAGIKKKTHISVATLIEDVSIAAAIEAMHRGLQLAVYQPAAEAMHKDAVVVFVIQDEDLFG